MYVFNFIVVGVHSTYICICEAPRSLRVLGGIKCVFIIIIIIIIIIKYDSAYTHLYKYAEN